MDSGTVINCALKAPFKLVLIAPSGAGKSTLVLNMLHCVNKNINTLINRVFYVYKHDQPIYSEFSKSHPGVEFLNDIDRLDTLVDGSEPTLLILDDYQQYFTTKAGSEYLTDWFTKKSRHLNCSIIVLLHNAYADNLRTVSINATYTIIFDFVRDRSTIKHLAYQLYPNSSKQLVEAYLDAVSSSRRGFLFLDHHPDTFEKNRVRNFLYPRQKDMKYYIIQ